MASYPFLYELVTMLTFLITGGPIIEVLRLKEGVPVVEGGLCGSNILDGPLQNLAMSRKTAHFQLSIRIGSHRQPSDVSVLHGCQCTNTCCTISTGKYCKSASAKAFALLSYIML